MITAPINLSSSARFDPRSECGLTVSPEGRDKSLQAVIAYLAKMGLPLTGALTLETLLPPGHGFGTSTADLVASLRAVADAWGRSITPDAISRIAIEIEPTDGSMYPESVAYAYREGRLRETLGPLPEFRAFVTCDGPEVATLDFEQRRKAIKYSEAEIAELALARETIRAAIRQQSVPLMAEACRKSARINERFLPKKYFGEMSSLVRTGIGEGLIAAHSGSALGLLLDPSCPDAEKQREMALEKLEEIKPTGWLEVSNCC